MNWIVFMWLGLSMIPFAFGEYCSKRFATTPCALWLILNLMASVSCTLLWFPAITKHNVISVVGLTWSLLSVIATLFVGLALFGEPLTTTKIIGIALAFLSITLMSL